MPDDLDEPDPSVPDYVPEEWRTRYGSATRLKLFTMPRLEEIGLVGLVFFVCVGLFGVAIASVIWPSPSTWGRLAILSSLAVVAGACWLMERLLAQGESQDSHDPEQRDDP